MTEKMAQYIRNNINLSDDFTEHMNQVSQINYHNERLIEIMWDLNTKRAVVQDMGEWFYFHSPDIPYMTIRQVVEGLGYGAEKVVVTWSYEQEEGINVLDTIINSHTSPNQIAIYSHDTPIPLEHYSGTLPALRS